MHTRTRANVQQQPRGASSRRSAPSRARDQCALRAARSRSCTLQPQRSRSPHRPAQPALTSPAPARRALRVACADAQPRRWGSHHAHAQLKQLLLLGRQTPGHPASPAARTPCRPDCARHACRCAVSEWNDDPRTLATRTLLPRGLLKRCRRSTSAGLRGVGTARPRRCRVRMPASHPCTQDQRMHAHALTHAVRCGQCGAW